MTIFFSYDNSRKLRYIGCLWRLPFLGWYGHAFIQATLYIIRIPLEETRPEGIIVFSVSLMLQPSTSLCLPTTQPCLSFSFSFSLLFSPFLFHFSLLFLLISPFFPLFFLFSFFFFSPLPPPSLFSHLFPPAIGAFTLIKRPARDVYPGGVSVTS